MKRYQKSKENKIREIVGLPNEDIFEAKGVVKEDMPCENTFSYAPPVKDGYKSLDAVSRLAPADTSHSIKGFRQNQARRTSRFDYGASGGASSPNTEVNAENQGIQSEIPSFPLAPNGTSPLNNKKQK